MVGPLQLASPSHTRNHGLAFAKSLCWKGPLVMLVLWGPSFRAHIWWTHFLAVQKIDLVKCLFQSYNIHTPKLTYWQEAGPQKETHLPTVFQVRFVSFREGKRKQISKCCLQDGCLVALPVFPVELSYSSGQLLQSPQAVAASASLDLWQEPLWYDAGWWSFFPFKWCWPDALIL